MRFPKDPVPSWRFFKFRRTQLSPVRGGENRLEFFWARNGLFHALSLHDISAGRRVLVPSYICSSAVEPILACGADVDFYRIDRSCGADFLDIERQIRPATVALVAVHYFGAPQPIEKFAEICERYGLLLVEDCAHVLVGEYEGKPLGSFGDVSFFSWRKFLPIYDGATLFLMARAVRQVAGKVRRERALLTLRVFVNLLERWANRRGGWFRRTVAGLLNAIQRSRNSIRASDRSEQMPRRIDSNDDQFDLESADLPMTRLSRSLIRHADVPAIVAARRANYEYLQRALASIDGVSPLWKDLPLGIAPWVFPVLIERGREVLASMRAAQIPVVSWSGVCHASLPRDLYADADFLYDNLLFLPLHQDLSSCELEEIVATLSSIIGSMGDSAVRLKV